MTRRKQQTSSCFPRSPSPHPHPTSPTNVAVFRSSPSSVCTLPPPPHTHTLVSAHVPSPPTSDMITSTLSAAMTESSSSTRSPYAPMSAVPSMVRADTSSIRDPSSNTGTYRTSRGSELAVPTPAPVSAPTSTPVPASATASASITGVTATAGGGGSDGGASTGGDGGASGGGVGGLSSVMMTSHSGGGLMTSHSGGGLMTSHSSGFSGQTCDASSDGGSSCEVPYVVSQRLVPPG